MNVDESPSNSKKRKNPHTAIEPEQDAEAGAYNEDPKARAKAMQSDAAMEFEDDFEDEYDEDDAPEGMQLEEAPEEEPEDDIMPDEENQDPEVWRPGINTLEEGEFLEYDPTAYDLIHFMRVDAPCLSFDILADSLGYERRRLPHTAYVVAGSTAPSGSKNKLTVMKMSKMHKTKYDGQEDDPNMEDEEEDDDEEFDEEAQLESHAIDHDGGVNRIRAMPQRSNIVATLSDTRKAHIWDLSKHIKALDVPSATKLKSPQALFTFTGHQDEGFALDWSTFVPGRLATGDCAGGLHIWNMSQAGTWSVNASIGGHQGSVEDVQWSSNEDDILATTGIDRSIRIWDVRMAECVGTDAENKHASDINVISWNHTVKNLIVSGGDDGIFKVWDLAMFHEPMFTFEWHAGPITSVEWSPHDASVLAVASEDNSVTLWDISLTKDPKEQTEYPPQLLFMHQGQKEIKEVHWHKQIPDMLITTAADGFNVWKPSLADQ